ncbi:shikimate dehydrogenase [Thermosyntropha lipolytica DSM 11003]|uniref:Shikimate dehydrogenase (NADP(+)) n=1 Tax=Thermosyntropha lipolytica DSM 11003 TaxID=1123382 RepID=A0A1M5LPG3_9FIRM|nr:shikimate dehydrogenase [Thermosyntropha lipolytica]SHG66994.1 shikimate dehydrogenase [Thermosyntropha lipolytica DSM 11003]
MLITAQTRVIGLYGYPLGHTLSPLMHNAVFHNMHLPYVYLPFEICPHNLASAVDAIKSLNILGVNVTIPFKEEVIKYLDDLSAEARACKAVNLIKNEEGKLIGYNTDGEGFLSSLREEGVNPAGKALLIGAGGAARAVSYALAKAGVEEICFLDLEADRAEKLAAFIEEETGIKAEAGVMNENFFNEQAADAGIIVNCSPAGMYPHIGVSPVENLDSILPEAVVCDIIYNPLKTLFLRKAEANGHKIINGLGMFVHQGALSLKILTGIDPPVKMMREVVISHIKE